MSESRDWYQSWDDDLHQAVNRYMLILQQARTGRTEVQRLFESNRFKKTSPTPLPNMLSLKGARRKHRTQGKAHICMYIYIYSKSCLFLLACYSRHVQSWQVIFFKNSKKSFGEFTNSEHAVEMQRLGSTTMTYKYILIYIYRLHPWNWTNTPTKPNPTAGSFPKPFLLGVYMLDLKGVTHQTSSHNKQTWSMIPEIKHADWSYSS